MIISTRLQCRGSEPFRSALEKYFYWVLWWFSNLSWQCRIDFAQVNMIIKPTEVEELQKNKKRTSSDGKNRSYLWLCSSDLLSWKMVVARSSMSTTTSSKIVKVSSSRVVVNFIFFFCLFLFWSFLLLSFLFHASEGT